MTVTVAPAEQADELRHEYSPRGSAVRLFNCRDDEVLLSGPAGPGKTRACLEKMLTMALVNGVVRTDRATGEPIRDADGKVKQHRPFVGLIARKTHKSLTSTTLETWREHVAAEALKGGLCVYYGGSATEPPQYRFANGSKILLTGLNDVTRVMGAEVDVVYVGEATECTPKDWEFLTSRLRNGAISFQQIMADCNPDRPTHWLKQRCDEGLTTILYAQHWENPRYFEDVGPVGSTDAAPGTVEEHEGRLYRLTPAGVSYLGRLDNLTGVRRQRLRLGLWTAADGLVFENWDPAVHIAEERFTIPEEWPRFWVIDFGYKNPFVCQWWAESPDDQLVLYREIYHTGRLVEDHARAMLRLVTRIAPRIKLTKDQVALVRKDPIEGLKQNWLVWTEPEPRAIICDHDAEDRATLTRHLGRGTTAARKTVTEGIQLVDARLKMRGNGKPGLLLLPDSLVERDRSLKEGGKPMSTAEEFGGYVWEPTPDGKQQKEVPLKLDDHGMDCVRYLTAHRDLRMRIRDREIGLEG
ncbi:MAG TPA: phage terminase large subunit [Propionibacteriaceae bacterium]|nr:phage terminase large subunit [Propionibacteriaceae bacterium]